MFDLIYNQKDLNDLTSAELQTIPVEYFIQNVPCLDLLQIWSKLPISYRQNVYLQVCLPCFGHYNKFITEIDGPPSSQANCHLCNNKFKLSC